MRPATHADGRRPGGIRFILVWDPVVRTTHWCIAIGCIANLSLLRHGDALHEWVGYLAFAAVLARISWGLVSEGHANIRVFLPSPTAVSEYLRLLAQRKEPRYVGHNPAGALMMVTLMLLVTVCGITGWMLGLDRFWGSGPVESVHATAANAIFILSIIHVSAALFESFRHRENLVLSMIHGRKRRR